MSMMDGKIRTLTLGFLVRWLRPIRPHRSLAPKIGTGKRLTSKRARETQKAERKGE